MQGKFAKTGKKHLQKTFTYYLMDKKAITRDYGGYFSSCYSFIKGSVEAESEAKKLREFEKALSKGKKPPNRIAIQEIDLMGGHDFEKVVARIFEKMGYSVTITKGSGDQGIDIIASRGSSTIGIQAKCYAGKVSNKAIQEVVAGVVHYKCDRGLVVTNNFFTDSAKELARTNNVFLWDREDLKKKLLLLVE